MACALVCQEAVVAMQPPGRSAPAAGEDARKFLGIKALLRQPLHDRELQDMGSSSQRTQRPWSLIMQAQ